MDQASTRPYRARVVATDQVTTGVVGPADPRPLRLARYFLLAGTTALCLLQLLVMPERNPLTRTMSSDEYTWAGWLFPLGLGVFGVGLFLLSRQVPRTRPAARIGLLVASLGAAVTAVFPAGSGRRGEPTWPGEVHRWGSIALVVGALSGAVLLAAVASSARRRRALGLLVLCGAVSGALFLVGQLVPPPPDILGYAPLAGGLNQRILVGVTAAAALQLVGLLTGLGARRPWQPDSVVSTGHGRIAYHSQADPSPVHP